jgi:hypothetical protein
MIRQRLHATPVVLHSHRDTRARLSRTFRGLGCALAATLAIGCGQANSTSPSKDDSMFGLFKSKSPSVVDPAVGATLVRESTFPSSPATPAVPAYEQPRRMALSALPPAGTLSPVVDGKSPAEAWVMDTPSVGLALVDVFEPKRRCELWLIDSKDGRKPATQVPLRFDANQQKWSAYNSQEVLALPDNKLLVLLQYRLPNPVNGLYLVDASGVVKTFGLAQPDWHAGLPSRFLDNLQLSPRAVLVAYRTDSVRLGAERYVNRFDHLVLFSPTHPLGLEVARIGIDDGNVRDWRFSGSKLWLQTSDDRGDAPKAFNWSLDLSRVL